MKKIVAIVTGGFSGACFISGYLLALPTWFLLSWSAMIITAGIVIILFMRKIDRKNKAVNETI